MNFLALTVLTGPRLHRHGTHLAGIISKLNDNCVKILPIKVVSDNGTGNVDNLIKGINEAGHLKANILLISLMTEYYREDFKREYLLD